MLFPRGHGNRTRSFLRRGGGDRAVGLSCVSRLEMDRHSAEERAGRAGREVNVADAPGRLAAQPGGEEKLRLPRLDVRQVLDAEKGFEVPVPVPRGRGEERVAAGREVAGPPRGARPPKSHLAARGEPPPPPR